MQFYCIDKRLYRMFCEKYKYWYGQYEKNKCKFILKPKYPVQFPYGIFFLSSCIKRKKTITPELLRLYRRYNFVKKICKKRGNNLQTIMQRVLSLCMCSMCRTYKYIRPSYVVRSISWRYSYASKSASNTVPRISILFHKVEFTPSYFLH